ncbi:Acid-resistant protein [Minicystis rosea]|nr:Acid-resistant protein [Minicystis rosea]
MDAARMLANTPLFEDLSPEDVSDLAEHLKRRTLRAGERIFDKGETGDSMYLVTDGVIAIYLPGDGGRCVPLKSVTIGQYFGELALFDEKPRSASAVAQTDCEILELERTALHAHIRERPRIAIALLSELSERIRETNALLSQRAAKDVNQEMAARATLADRVADKVASGVGSWTFILTFLGALVLWVSVNSVALSKMLRGHEPFDPFPYIFFNLILSIVAAFQGPVIMMSQNRQAEKDRAQAETDFKVNLKNEVGIEGLLAGMQEIKAHLTILEKSALAAPRPRNEIVKN